jgi:Na+/melibiose symporter-like transporter
MKTDSRYVETPKIGFMEKLGFGTFSTASNVVFNFKDLFYLFFLTNVMGIKIEHAGMITALGIVWDAVNDPLVGYWAVNHTFKNGEKCRPFALWCAVPWAVTVVLMFTCFDVAYGMKLAIAIAIYFLFELFNTFAAIPYNSMGGLATNRDSDRRAINVARNLGGCVGSGIGGVALYPLLNLFGGLDANGNVIVESNGHYLVFSFEMSEYCEGDEASLAFYDEDDDANHLFIHIELS